MPGFSPLDTLYFQRPSARVGGWIAFLIEHQNRTDLALPAHRLSLRPDSNPLCTTRITHCASVDDALDRLRSEHDDRFWYRGQTRRFAASYHGVIAPLQQALPAVRQVAIEFESLVPTLYRDVAAGTKGGWSSYVEPTKLDRLSTAIRAIVNSRHEALRHLLAEYLREVATEPAFLLREVASRTGFARVRLPEHLLAPQTSVSLRLLHLISIAQHYECPSSMVDVTRDLDVAAWFATHEWSGAAADSNEGAHGVLYRFDGQKINELVRKEFDRELPHAGSPILTSLLGFADISDVGSDYGERPRAQHGGSVLGLENSLVYVLTDSYGALEIFTFPQGPSSGAASRMTRNELCPPNDPALAVFTPQALTARDRVSDEDLNAFMAAEGIGAEHAGIILRARRTGFL